MFKNIVPKFLLLFLIICAMGLRPSLDAQEKTDLNASIQPELSSDKPIVADQASGEKPGSNTGNCFYWLTT